MAEPQLALTRLAGTAGQGDLLVVGPSLGTSVEAVWGAAAARLADRFEVVGWDLPGHGRSTPATEPFSIAELAVAVRRLAAQLVGGRARRASYAGVSLGGAVALELALEPGVFGHAELHRERGTGRRAHDVARASGAGAEGGHAGDGRPVLAALVR